MPPVRRATPHGKSSAIPSSPSARGCCSLPSAPRCSPAAVRYSLTRSGSSTGRGGCRVSVGCRAIGAAAHLWRPDRGGRRGFPGGRRRPEPRHGARSAIAVAARVAGRRAGRAARPGERHVRQRGRTRASRAPRPLFPAMPCCPGQPPAPAGISASVGRRGPLGFASGSRETPVMSWPGRDGMTIRGSIGSPSPRR
jgi:hypothetical protein